MVFEGGECISRWVREEEWRIGVKGVQEEIRIEK
jgi:hypothetical protein